MANEIITEEVARKQINPIINEVISKSGDLITELDDMNKLFGIEHNYSNAGVRFNNKINELKNVFNEHGMSLFTRYEPSIGINQFHLIGEAIFDALYARAVESLDAMKAYLEAYSSAIHEMSNIFLNKMIPIAHFIKRRNITLNGFQLTPQEKEKIAQLYIEYQDKADAIWNFSLEDNLVDALIELFKKGECNSYYIKDMLDIEIIPMMNQLGLSNSVDELLTKLRENGYNLNESKEEIVDIPFDFNTGDEQNQGGSQRR